MWLWLVIFGHLINAVAFLVDKILLIHVVRPPHAYAFFIGALSAVALFLVPFGVVGVSAAGIAADLLVGILFIIALWSFFAALKVGEASRVVPFLGGGIPVVTWIIERILGERFMALELVAIVVLTLGTVLIAWEPKGFYHGKHQTPWHLAVLAILCFGISMALARLLFETQGFIAGFFWQRMGSVLAALGMLFIPRWRREIAIALHELPLPSAAAFLGNQLLGALGFFSLQFALTRVSATIVQSLQGVQYVFLFVLVLVLSVRYPKLLREQVTPVTIMLKLAATALIVSGIAVLAR